MECHAFDSGEAFLSRTAVFFQDREAENTILLGAVRAMGEAPETGDLLLGLEDPPCNAHGENESLDLDDFRKAARASAHLLEELREVPRWR